MGLQGAAYGPPSGVVDVGALFGLGACAPAQPEKSWQWEAPSLGNGFAPPPLPPKPVDWMSGKFLWKRAEVQKVDAVDAVQESKDAFGRLLSYLKGDDVHAHDMEKIVRFLHSDRDEPEANNLATLAAWLPAKKGVRKEARQLLARCLRDKAQLQTLITEPLPSLFAFLVPAEHKPHLETALAETLDALRDAERQEVVVLTAQALVGAHERGEASLLPLESFLRILDSCDKLTGKHAGSSTWKRIYELIAERKRAPARFSQHLKSLEKVDLARVLLRHWSPLYAAEDVSEARSQESIEIRQSRVLSFTASLQSEIDIEHIMRQFEELCLESSRRSRDPETALRRHALAKVFVVMQRNRIPHTPMLHNIIDMYAGSPDELWTLFLSLRRHPELGISTTVGKMLISHLSAGGRPAKVDGILKAWRVFQHIKTMSPLHFPDLPLDIIEAGQGNPERIFDILNRKVGEDIEHIENRARRKLALLPAHIDMAHAVAYAYAKQPTVTPRVALRRVWEVYRFLQDRGAPLTPVMSRALVRAGLLRYMQEGQNAPAELVKYIVGIVRDIEGEEVAKRVDAMVWVMNKQARMPGSGYWSKKRILPDAAKLDWESAQVEQKAVATLRRRLKRWVKAGPQRAPQAKRSAVAHVSQSGVLVETASGQSPGRVPFAPLSGNVDEKPLIQNADSAAR